MPGQNIPNPEGYATMSKFNLTREIFNILAQVFQINLQPKKITEVPESFILFKDKKRPISIKNSPLFKRFRVGSFP